MSHLAWNTSPGKVHPACSSPLSFCFPATVLKLGIFFLPHSLLSLYSLCAYAIVCLILHSVKIKSVCSFLFSSSCLWDAHHIYTLVFNSFSWPVQPSIYSLRRGIATRLAPSWVISFCYKFWCGGLLVNSSDKMMQIIFQTCYTMLFPQPPLSSCHNLGNVKLSNFYQSTNTQNCGFPFLHFCWLS